MKIVVYGPHRRVGALRGDLVVDLSLSYAKLLKEQQNEAQATLLASALVPSDLAMFIGEVFGCKDLFRKTVFNQKAAACDSRFRNCCRCHKNLHRSVQILENACGAHAAADAHRDDSVPAIAALQFSNDACRQLCTGAAEGMS